MSAKRLMGIPTSLSPLCLMRFKKGFLSRPAPTRIYKTRPSVNDASRLSKSFCGRSLKRDNPDVWRTAEKSWPDLYLEINLYPGKCSGMRMSETVNEEYVHNKDRVLAIALAIIVAVYGALYFYFAVRALIWVPVMDMFDWLLFYGNRLQAGDLFGYLWDPHNEHHIVWSRILLAIDVRWFGGPGPAFALFGLLLNITMIATICWEIKKSDFSASLKATAIPIAILLLLPSSTVVNIGLPIYCGFMHTAAFAVFSRVVLDGAAEQGPFYRRTAAIAAACLAAFGVSGGLLIWPVLMWSAWKGGLGRGWIAVIACVGGAFSALYVWGNPLSVPAFVPFHRSSCSQPGLWNQIPWSSLVPRTSARLAG